MVTQQNSIKHDAFLQENGHGTIAAVYPVDLSLFQDISRTHLAPVDVSFKSLSDWGDPIAAAQCALAWWNRQVASGEEQSREAFLSAALWLVEQAQSIGGDAAGWPLAY